jgi:hypothetical protein
MHHQYDICQERTSQTHRKVYMMFSIKLEMITGFKTAVLGVFIETRNAESISATSDLTLRV